MRRGRNAGIDQRLEDMRLRFAALRLHRVAQRLLHEARGVDERAVDRVVALIRHAAEHEGVRRAAADRLRRACTIMSMVAGTVLRWPCAIIARLSPEHRHVDAGHLGPLRRGVVGHRHVDHLLAGLLRLADFGDGALLALALGFGDLGPGRGRFGRRGFGRRLRRRHCTPRCCNSKVVFVCPGRSTARLRGALQTRDRAHTLPLWRSRIAVHCVRDTQMNKPSETGH